MELSIPLSKKNDSLFLLFPAFFTGGLPLGYGVQRRDMEVRFP